MLKKEMSAVEPIASSLEKAKVESPRKLDWFQGQIENRLQLVKIIEK
jgi:hypothetical protein